MDGSIFTNEVLQLIKSFVLELTAIPSISNHELEACDFCYTYFKRIAGVSTSKQYLDNSIKHNPRWNCGPYPGNDYTGHYNIEAIWKGSGEQPPVYLNAHLDTVAPCVPSLMPPRVDGDTVYGLGSHDDKGHIAAIYALFRHLSERQIKLPFDVIAHLVVEEEIGGNGSLAAVSQSQKGQAAIILDGGGGFVANACRGAIWPRVTCFGDSCHPSDRQSIKFFSAFDLLKKAVSAIEKVHAEYCAEVAQKPVKYFEGLVPPLNIGSVHAGNWPSTIPTEAVADMVFGVFPDQTNAQMRKRIETALETDQELRGHYKLEFIFDVDAGVTNNEDPLVVQMQKAMADVGFSGEVKAFNGACDIGFYRNILGIPAINVGIGEQNAHSMHESVKVGDILKLAQALLNWLNLRAGVN